MKLKIYFTKNMVHRYALVKVGKADKQERPPVS
ncbi:MAG: hypothetical protein ACJAUO_002034 [Sediminicola sp.]|jgi:hypothetical protein